MPQGESHVRVFKRSITLIIITPLRIRLGHLCFNLNYFGDLDHYCSTSEDKNEYFIDSKRNGKRSKHCEC